MMILDEAAERLFGKTPPAPESATHQVDDAADILFGATAPEPEAQPPATDPGPDTEQAPEEARQPRTDAEMRETLYPEAEKPAPLAEVPPEVKELRDLPERRMFSAQDTFSEAIPDLGDEACKQQDADPAAVRQGMAEMRELAADLDLGVPEVQTLRQRAGKLSESPVETITQRESAVEALNREFGNGAYQAWQDARALVARDPRVGKVIEALGLGDDADTIVMLARKAHSQRAAGKFKTRI